jgi:hypothetical protein
MSKHLVITWGRFQPPHWDHKKLIEDCDSLAAAKHGNVIIFPSYSFDKKKNPLTHSQKIYWLNKMFPYHSFYYDTTLKTLFDVVKHVVNDLSYYETIDLVVGADRYEEFSKKVLPNIHKFIATECDRIPKSFEVVSTWHENTIHSSTLRDLVKHGLYGTFRDFYFTNTILKGTEIWELWIQLREGMGYATSTNS